LWNPGEWKCSTAARDRAAVFARESYCGGESAGPEFAGRSPGEVVMIKTLIFDLGGVYFTSGTRNAPEKFRQLFGIPDAKTNEVLNGPLGMRYRMGLLTEEAFWREAQTIFGTDIDFRRLRDVWLSAYIPIDGTIDLIDNLKSNGYEILYLSENVEERIAYLENRYRFIHHFHSGVFSYQANMVKPDIKLYELVLGCTKSRPSECVFIDDKDDFLEPARKLGMSAVQFQNPLQLRDDLMSLGVVFG
jgi:putative hydrolase of the HAD superfamily